MGFLLETAFVPFSFALALFFGLLLLEIVAGLVGATLLGLGSNAEFDLELSDVDFADIDFDVVDLDAVDLEAFDISLSDFEGSDVQALAPSGVAGLLGWLGLGKVPMLIWIATFLVGFGLTGMTVQVLWQEFLNFTLPVMIVAVAAGVIGLWIAKSFGRVFARILPKTETTALSERRLGRRRGIITSGTARRGSPAEVRVNDQFQNTHYIRAEPLRDDAKISAGTEVLVLRATFDGSYYLVEIPN
ncbi:MAG: OB-fold-containig protein [Pseudomonadota bacterium]